MANQDKEINYRKEYYIIHQKSLIVQLNNEENNLHVRCCSKLSTIEQLIINLMIEIDMALMFRTFDEWLNEKTEIDNIDFKTFDPFAPNED